MGRSVRYGSMAAKAAALLVTRQIRPRSALSPRYAFTRSRDRENAGVSLPGSAARSPARQHRFRARSG